MLLLAVAQDVSRVELEGEFGDLVRGARSARCLKASTGGKK